jgi:hypothetical protein
MIIPIVNASATSASGAEGTCMPDTDTSDDTAGLLLTVAAAAERVASGIVRERHPAARAATHPARTPRR